MPKAVPIQSIKRALDLLDYLSVQELHGRGTPLRELAEAMDIAPATARNILRTISACGYIEQDAGHRYRLGAKCRQLYKSSRLFRNIPDSVASIIYALAEETGEEIVLTTLLQGKRYVILRVQSKQIVRVDSSLEGSKSFYSLVTGQILAAFASPAELDMIIEKNGLPGMAWNAIDSREGLVMALRKVRNDGMAAQWQKEHALTSLAVPVLDEDGELLAALGCYLPSFRADKGRFDFLAGALKRAARQIGISWKI